MASSPISRRLAAAGRRRTKAMAAKAAASAELTELVPMAAAAGIPIAEIQRLSGLSRQGVRDFLAQG